MSEKCAVYADKLGYIKDITYGHNPSSNFKFTDDINKAKLLTREFLVREWADHLARKKEYSFSFVPVTVSVSPHFSKADNVDKIVDDVMAMYQIEYDQLSAIELDDLSEKEFRRFRRLKRCIENREIDAHTNYDRT